MQYLFLVFIYFNVFIMKNIMYINGRTINLTHYSQAWKLNFWYRFTVCIKRSENQIFKPCYILYDEAIKLHYAAYYIIFHSSIFLSLLKDTLILNIIYTFFKHSLKMWSQHISCNELLSMNLLTFLRILEKTFIFHFIQF